MRGIGLKIYSGITHQLNGKIQKFFIPFKFKCLQSKQKFHSFNHVRVKATDLIYFA